MKRYEDFFKEAQQYSTILKNYEENGEIFTDPNFHPDYTITEPKIKIDNENFTWRRIDEFYTAPLFKKEFIRPDDIDEGQLCDSGLIAALAWTATKPERVKQLFNVQTLPNQPDAADMRCGAVVVKLHAFGRTTPILIDTRVPFLKGTRRPAFSRPRRFGCSAWFCLVEKAVAKLFGGYSAVSGLTLTDACSAVLGFSPIEATTPDYKTVVKWLDAGEVVGATAESETAQEGPVSDLGLVSGGFYLALRARDACGMGFFVLRSPRASIEWLGGWSATSVELTSDVRAKLGLACGSSGTFCMIESDFFKHFTKVAACGPCQNLPGTALIHARVSPGECDGCEVNSPTACLGDHQAFVVCARDDSGRSGDVKIDVTVEKWGPPETPDTPCDSGIDAVVASCGGEKLQSLTQVNHQKFTSNDRIFTFSFNAAVGTPLTIVFHRNTKRPFAEDLYATLRCPLPIDVTCAGGGEIGDQPGGTEYSVPGGFSVSDAQLCSGFSDDDLLAYSSEDDVAGMLESGFASIGACGDVTDEKNDSLTESIEKLKGLSNDSQIRVEEKVPLFFGYVRSLMTASRQCESGFIQKVCDMIGMDPEESGYDTILLALQQRLGMTHNSEEKTAEQAGSDAQFDAFGTSAEDGSQPQTDAKSDATNSAFESGSGRVNEPGCERIVFDSIEPENRNEAASNEEPNSAMAAALEEESLAEIEVEFEGQNQPFDFEKDEEGSKKGSEVIDDVAINDADDVKSDVMQDNAQSEQSPVNQEMPIIKEDDESDVKKNDASEVSQNDDVKIEIGQNSASEVSLNDDVKIEINQNDASEVKQNGDVKCDVKQNDAIEVSQNNDTQNKVTQKDDAQIHQTAENQEGEKPRDDQQQKTEKRVPTRMSQKLRSIRKKDGELDQLPVSRRKKAPQKTDAKTTSQTDSSQPEAPKRAPKKPAKRASSQPRSEAPHTSLYPSVASDAEESPSSASQTWRVKPSDDPDKPFEVTREVKRRNRRSSSQQRKPPETASEDVERVSFSEPIKKPKTGKATVGVKITITDPDGDAEVSVTKKRKATPKIRQKGDRLKSHEEKKEPEKAVSEVKDSKCDETKETDKNRHQKAPKKKKENRHTSKSVSSEKVQSTEKPPESHKKDEHASKKKDAAREKSSRRASSVAGHSRRSQKAADDKAQTEVEISVAFDRSKSSSDAPLFFPFSATYHRLLHRRRTDYEIDGDFNFVGDENEFESRGGYYDTRLGYEREYFSLRTGGSYTNPGAVNSSSRRRNPSASSSRRPPQNGYVNFLGLHSDQINCSYLPKRLNWY